MSSRQNQTIRVHPCLSVANFSFPFWRLGALAFACFLALSCNRAPAPATTTTTQTATKSPRIASLVPAASDLLIGMGAADHLVAVSNWDTKRPENEKLPRV